ncbi:MAG TPA: 50S ribosomal protein L11 methyltransferase [Casimicrobiaceae bacterium]|nr:50S ribosomal protein L11 methyltransferase [Casimicrobiaceae bacterium]
MTAQLRPRFAVTIAAIGFGAIACANDGDERSVSPYAATPDSVVVAMLAMAAVGPRDYVIDLGSGDGRLVIAAVKRGARALGVDIDAKLVDLARRFAERDGVAERALFVEQDLFATDLSQASVITIYLLPSIMGKVATKLAAELRPGARVVTHDFPLPGWRIDRVEQFDVPEKRDYTFNDRATIYLYTVPATSARR